MSIYEDIEKKLSSEGYEYLKVFTYRTYKLYGQEYYCDICIVRNREKKKVFIRLQKRWYGISKAMRKEGKKRARWIVIKSYNFPQKYEFERVRKIFDQISKGDVKSVGPIMEGSASNLTLDEIKRLQKKLSKLRKLKRRDRKSHEEITKLREQIAYLDKENKTLKKDSMRSQVPEFRGIIKAARSDLERKGENYFQKLLENNGWIFGPSYEEIIPKRKADPENQPDFALKRYDGFCDIVEIESPDKLLFTKPDRSGKMQPTAALIHAITQAMDYIDSYNQEHEKMYYKDVQAKVPNPLHAYHPRGYVIVGRDKGVDRKRLRQLNNFLHNIVVMTWDEFFEQSDRMLNILEK